MRKIDKLTNRGRGNGYRGEKRVGKIDKGNNEKCHALYARIYHKLWFQWNYTQTGFHYVYVSSHERNAKGFFWPLSRIKCRFFL